MALSIPPPSRIAIGTATVNGQQVEVSLSPEWARYLESLNTLANTTASAVGLPGAPGTTGAAGVGVALSDDPGGSMEFIPGPPGPSGPQGIQGPFGVNLDDSGGSVEFIPGPPGQTGAQGAAGPALFLMQEQPEAPDLPGQPTALDETFIVATLLNSWVNFDITSFNAAGYYKDSGGIVHLHGIVKSGTVGASMFVLPAGYRPAKQEIISCLSNDALGKFSIQTTGDIVLQIGSNVYASLDGITFRAAGTY